MGYGNYMGMGGMGGMGSQSTTLMSSAMGASACLSMLAAGGLYFMNRQTTAPAVEDTSPAVEVSTTTPASASSPGDLDGARVITVGGNAMYVDGTCSNGKVAFRRSVNDKWVWNLKKVGTTSDGLNYYTMESFGKLFGNACNKRYLTAPTMCKGAPYLAGPQRGPQQYWVITGNASSGYQIESLLCRQSRTKSYLLQSGTSKKAPQFSLRGGSSFRIDADTNV